MKNMFIMLTCVALVVLGTACEEGSQANDDGTAEQYAEQPASEGASPPLDAPEAGHTGDARLRADCQNNLKHLGLVLKMYASESKGERYPCLSLEAGRFAFAHDVDGAANVYPEYLTDLGLLVCPADVDLKLLKSPVTGRDTDVMVDDHSYYYLGYAVVNEGDVKRFAEAYKERIAEGLEFDEDLKTPDGMIWLLREGISRFLITDINDPGDASEKEARIPLLIERPENHNPPGGNVLFMDGHVEFILYGERWPMTKSVVDTLRSLEID